MSLTNAPVVGPFVRTVTNAPASRDQLTQEEKYELIALAGFVLIGGYYSPIDNRTVTMVAITGGLGAAFSDTGKFEIEKRFENLTMFQRIIAWTVLGASVGIGIDTLLRPKLNPERI